MRVAWPESEERRKGCILQQSQCRPILLRAVEIGVDGTNGLADTVFGTNSLANIRGFLFHNTVS